MHEDAAGAAACAIGQFDWKHLSDDDILKLSIADFMTYLGKRIVNPGGIAGRDRLLEIVQPKPDSHVLEIGAGNGHAACHIARTHGCRVTTISGSARAMREAQALVARQDLTHLVRCEIGDIDRLRFADHTFDYVVCQAVFTFVRHQKALSEVRRVLKDDGTFAGLEFCWKRLPPDPLRARTRQIFASKVLDFHSLFGWIGALRGSEFDVIRAEEHALRVPCPAGLLRDEGWANGLRIVARLMRRRAGRVRMTEIWAHFSHSMEYYSYIVFSGGKKGRMQATAPGEAAWKLQAQRA